MNKLRAGVVGMGMGGYHVEEFSKHPHVDLVAISDIDAARLKAVGEIFTERNGFHCDLNPLFSASPPPGPIKHFVDSILEDKPHMATGEEGLMVQELLDTLYESAWAGRPIQLPKA